MSEKMEKESMKKFFEYIKGQTYPPGRGGYPTPSAYYPHGYPYPPMTAPSQLNISASNTQQNQHQNEEISRPLNSYAQYYKHAVGMYGYPGYPNIYGMPPPPVMAMPAIKLAQNGQTSGNLGYSISQKSAGNQNGMQQISSSQPSIGYPPNSPYGYGGCPYYPYMNPYNPYEMYPSYYYNRMGEGYNGTHPLQQKQFSQSFSNIKQEIVISSDEENNSMKNELGAKKNKNGYMVFEKEKNLKEKDKLKNNVKEIQKIKQKMKDCVQNNIERSQQKQSEYINDENEEEIQEDNKDKYYEKRIIKEAKLRKQTNEEVKLKTKMQAEIKPSQNQMDMEEDNNQQQKQKNKKGLEESNFSPFVIKKRIVKAKFKNTNQANKSQKKKLRDKNSIKIQSQFKDRDLSKDRNQNHNISDKLDQKGYINKADNKKIRSQQQKKSEDKKGEQLLKKDKTRDDHPLKQLRYSQSHGKIRIGAYYQSAIPHLLSGDRVMLLRKKLQNKLRERQISALTF